MNDDCGSLFTGKFKPFKSDGEAAVAVGEESWGVETAGGFIAAVAATAAGEGRLVGVYPAAAAATDANLS